MRYLVGLMCVLALGVMAVVGCTDDGSNGGIDPCEGVACNDGNECTKDACNPADGTCVYSAIDDGSFCDRGYCQMGQCEPIASVFPCDEQGIIDAIAAGGGPHGFGCDGPTVVTTTATIAIDNDVILDGRNDLTVDGSGEHPVFSVPMGVTAGLRRFTVTGGFYPSFGGPGGWGAGVSNEGTLDVMNCNVSRNVAEGLAGAGIGSSGTLLITNSTVSENTAHFFGGIWNLGTMDLTDSMVSKNVALDESLGVNGMFNDADYGSAVGARGILTVTNSTVSENTGGNYGGICNNRGTVTVTNSTVSANAGDTSGGLFNGGPPGGLTILNSTVSGNTAASGASIVNVTNAPSGSAVLAITNSAIEGDCEGYPQGAPDISSNGYNIESPGNTCGFDQATDQVNVTPEQLNLGPLEDNGGPTMTHALGAGSVAIDHIPADMCAVDEDQRGFPRDTMCDVGAFELQP